MKTRILFPLSLLALAACSAAPTSQDGSDPSMESAAKARDDLFLPPIRLSKWGPLASGCTPQNSCWGKTLIPAASSGVQGSWAVSQDTSNYLFRQYGDNLVNVPPMCESGTANAGPTHPPCIQNVTSLQVDVVGDPWWIDSSSGHIHVYFSQTNFDFDLDQTMVNSGDEDGGPRWMSVSAGAPISSATDHTGDSQVWAIAPSGSIYALMGHVSAPYGYVSPYAGWFPVGGSAVQIAFMNETNATSFCGSSWHIPWVRTAAGQVFEFTPGENNCYTGGWTQLPTPVPAKQIASGDVMLGTNGIIYRWSASSGAFVEAVQPPIPSYGSIESIGGQPGNTANITAVDQTFSFWEESCGTFGC